MSKEKLTDRIFEISLETIIHLISLFYYSTTNKIDRKISSYCSQTFEHGCMQILKQILSKLILKKEGTKRRKRKVTILENVARKSA